MRRRLGAVIGSSSSDDDSTRTHHFFHEQSREGHHFRETSLILNLFSALINKCVYLFHSIIRRIWACHTNTHHHSAPNLHLRAPPCDAAAAALHPAPVASKQQQQQQQQQQQPAACRTKAGCPSAGGWGRRATASSSEFLIQAFWLCTVTK